MQLVAIFKIEPMQERWFRDRLPRLSEEINHGGLEITIMEPAAAPVTAPEAVPTAEVEFSPASAAAGESQQVEPETKIPDSSVPLTRGRARKRAVTV